MASPHPKGLSPPEVTSSYAKTAPVMGEHEEQQGHKAEEDDEEGLELGLSLGAGKGGKAPRGPCAGQWGEYCRILTAKDFPCVGLSRVSPMSSSSSVSSSSSMGGRGAAPCKPAADPAPSNQMVGWPPIRASRINSLFNHAKDISPGCSPDAQQRKTVGVLIPAPKTDNSAKSVQEIVDCNIPIHHKKLRTFFVKVKMDGMPIGRKVDLNAHSSYESLALALEGMFQNNPKPKMNASQNMRTSKLLDGASDFVLTYEDKDGDWMLVGDVPWRMFLSTIKRLRIMRTTDANGLAPRIRCQRNLLNQVMP